MTPVPVQPQPPIDTVPAPAVSGATPKKKNYLPWLLGILVLVVIPAAFFLILTSKSKLTPTSNKVKESSAEINEPKTILEIPVIINNPELIKFVKNRLKMTDGSLVSIEKIEGNYALGSAGTKDGPGFYWAAAKKDGQWNYAFGGNGIPECKEVEIFPVGTFKLAIGGGKFDECYNNKNELIDRKTGLPVK